MIDPSWGMAVGGMGVGFGFFMLRSAAVVWTNGKKGNVNGNGMSRTFCDERSGNIIHWMEKIEKRLGNIEQALRK